MRGCHDRVALVTGAGQGLGRAMTARLAADGATVAVCDVNDVGLKETAAACPPATVWPTVVDVSVADEVRDWTTGVLRRFGRIDILVNNAGVIRDNRLENLSDDDWETVIGVNLRGVFNCARAVLATMKDQHYGRILSLSSMSWRGNFGQANYAAAKAGVIGMARTIALEGAPYGITSNVIAPGLIDTPMLASMNAAGRTKLTGRIPMGRIGSPEDIAEAAAYLCSDSAAYVTGVVLDVDGGIGIGSSAR
ncbi:MAG TPA: 3-oxoacyl-ACP reductase FabG [Pseudonocardiaceae bacterium]|jgi:3-oxoacyl-[acyl-carrier protein] reductase|nr:3-oxoacyl-ACP reductase FabG [Pseudonocardiaceae bacterium]